MDAVPAKWAVIPFTIIQMIALSTNYYVVPQLVVHKICHKTFNQTVCSQLGQPKFKSQENHVYNRAAAWNAMINFAGLFPSLIVILPLGAMADLISKKKMLLLPAIANLLSGLIHLCSAIFVTLPMGFLVFASFATSIFGEISGCTVLCCAYASCASTNDRMFALTMIVASVEIGLGTGSFVENYLIRYYGFTSAFLFVTTGLIASLFYAIFFIPPIDNVDKKVSQEEQIKFWDGFKRYAKDTWFHFIYFVKRYILHSKNNTILLLLIGTFFHFASYGGERALITFFLKHSPLNFRADKIGIYLTLYSWGRTLGLLILAITFKIYHCQSDYPPMFIGISSMIICFAVLSFSKTKLMVYLTTMFAIPTPFMSSSVRSQLTKLVTTGEHAVVLSFVGLINGLGMCIMSVAANGLFVATVQIYSGFSILLMSFSNIIALFFLCYVYFTKGDEGITNDKYGKALINIDNTE